MQNQILNNWQKVKLGEYADVKGGKRLPMGFSVQDQETDHPYLRIVDMNEAGLDTSDIKYISDEVFKRISRYTISDKDLYISIAGTIGFVGKIPQSLSGANLTENCAKICNFSEDLDRDFLLYFLKSYKGKAEIKAGTGGSSQPKLALHRIENFQLLLPLVGIQKKITSILSDFDEKIEINNKVAKNLEETAQAIFKEWFVKFKFSRYKKAEFVDSELGRIPEGWRIGKLSDTAKTIMGQSPASKFYNQRSEGLPFHQGVTNFGKRFPNHEIYCIQNNRIAQEGDMLFSVRAPVGRLNIADTKISLGRGVASIRQKNNCQSYLYYLLKRLFKKEDSLGGGSVFPSVTKADMEGMKILLPIEGVIEKFENIVSNMDKKIELVEKENQKLVALRDLLLPKLMKGEIRV